MVQEGGRIEGRKQGKGQKEEREKERGHTTIEKEIILILSVKANIVRSAELRELYTLF